MIFPAFYFGPISYHAALEQTKNFQLEIFENFPKQTYRNRCYIQGANGKLRLAIPTRHNGARMMKDIEISYEYNWIKEHQKSLVSAYKSSPYFEFYEDDLNLIYIKKHKFLLDLNLETFAFVRSKLKLNFDFTKTEDFRKVDEERDWRTKFDAKSTLSPSFPRYMQVFEDKFEFMPDLSILDLLFNLGPKSKDYLTEIRSI